MKLINRIRAWLSTEARTVGVSPKILAAPIAALLATGLNKIGVTPQDLADVFGTTATVIVGAELFVAGLVATWLLPPGETIAPAPILEGAADDRVPLEQLDAPADPLPPADAGILTIEAALAVLILCVAVVVLLRAFG